MARKPAGSAVESPPYLSLDNALLVAREIQESGGGTLSLESLAAILENSPKSSSFQRKLSALKNFGLVDQDRDTIRLTRLALGYVAPMSGEEQARSRAEIMRSVDLLRSLHDRFAGGVLPSSDSLANLILREYGAKEPLHKQWAEFFIESLRDAELTASVGGRVTVRRSPDGGPVPRPSPSDDAPQRNVRSSDSAIGRDVATVDRSDSSPRVEVPLHDGSVAAVLLPRTANPDDIGDIIDMLQIMKRRAERARPPDRVEE